MSDQIQERALRPIYAFLDTYNYNKALKLTYNKPQCNWAITAALRAHCLERCGKKLDACRELRILVGALTPPTPLGTSEENTDGNQLWCELDELIWILGLGSEGERSTVGVAGDSSSGSSGNSSGGGGNSSSSKGKKGKGKSSSSKASASSATTSKSKHTEKPPLDLIHVLDLPQFKRQEIIASSKYVEKTFTNVKNEFVAEDVLDGVSVSDRSINIIGRFFVSFLLTNTVFNTHNNNLFCTNKDDNFNYDFYNDIT